MRKIKLSNSEVRLLLTLLACLMLAGAYFLSYQKNVELSEEIEAQNEEDRAYVELLESMIARRPQVEAQTEEYLQTIDDIIAKYPPDVPTEKAITIIQEIEDHTGASVNNISFSMGSMVAEVATANVAEAAEDGDAQNADTLAYGSSIGYRDTLSMTYEAGYSDFKRMIAYIDGLTDRTTIPSITASYNNGTGNIGGSITINMYYLTNTGREYDVPDITGINKGVPDIFRSGSGSVRAGAAAEEAAAEAGEGDEENEEEQE